MRYSFPDLAAGTWNIEVEMLCFVPMKQDVTLAAEAEIPAMELKLLPLEEIKAAAGPQAAPSPVQVAIRAPEAKFATDPKTGKPKEGSSAASGEYCWRVSARRRERIEIRGSSTIECDGRSGRSGHYRQRGFD